jgi:hypothetical protein
LGHQHRLPHQSVGLGPQHSRTIIICTTIYHSRRGDGTFVARAHQNTLVDIEPSMRPDTKEEIKWRQTPPHRKGRRRAGPFAAVPLHQSKTSRWSENTGSD